MVVMSQSYEEKIKITVLCIDFLITEYNRTKYDNYKIFIKDLQKLKNMLEIVK
jgi:mannose/fructose/N-acetylgalactosamine-specific phosphotransferase system component IIB